MKSRSNARSARSLIIANHEVGVDVAISGVPEAGHRNAGVRLQFLGEFDELDQFGARNHDVLVELVEPGLTEGIRKLTTKFPNAFARGLVRSTLDEGGTQRFDELMELLKLGGHRSRAAVDLDDQVGVSGRKRFRAKHPASGTEREGIGDFHSGWKMTGIEDRLHGGGRHRELGKNRRQHRSVRGLGNETQRGFGDNP